MRDALGGTVSIAIIVIFIVIALGYLAFNVNYTKAFRMKDKIITLYDYYDGNCGSACQDEIYSYAREIGYATDNNLVCPEVTEGKGVVQRVRDLYCEIKYDVSDNSNVVGDRKGKIYYRIITKINLQVPIISNIFDFRFFYISADTKTYTK